ncbi:MAG: GTP-binding protein [Promethearchaeota archaeon]|nr:MAG: GTP-binding protein [Candidatus Lokiarchaeota archaeon]
MSSEDIKEFVFKIVVLGNSAVGKTSLINQYVESTFQEDYKPTLGANIIRKDVDIGGDKIRLIMWDLAGQKKYQSIRSMYFQGCVGALLVYDVTRPKTFEAIKDKWLSDFKKYVEDEGSYILIGNKIDLKEERKVDTNDGEELANEINASSFIETSAKYGENVEEAFKTLVRKILGNFGEGL